MRVTVIADRCVGCRVCELVCSDFHDGVFQPSKARIQILSFDETVQDIPLVCQQCPDAPCIAACPTEALYRDEKTQAVVVNQDLCIQCQACIDACVVGFNEVESNEKLVIRFDETEQMPIKCNLCDGDPRCVQFCPTQALLLTDKTAIPQELPVEKMTQVLKTFLDQAVLTIKQEEQ
jgi:Fe-S-cluster-containing hydrogenase component 2